MENLFLKFDNFVLMGLALIQLIFFIGMLASYSKNKKHMLIYSAWIALGLFAFTTVNALGWLLKDGFLLKLLNRISYGVLGFIVGLFLIVGGYAAKFKDGSLRILWLLTLALQIGGAVVGVISPTVYEEIGALMHYTHNTGNIGILTIAYAIITIGLPALMLIFGLIILFSQKNFKILLGSLLYCGIIAAGYFLLDIRYALFIYIAAMTILLWLIWSYGAKLEKPKY